MNGKGGLPWMVVLLGVGAVVVGLVPQTVPGQTYTGEEVSCGSAWFPGFEFTAAERLYAEDCAEALTGPVTSSWILLGLAVVALIAMLMVSQLVNVINNSKREGQAS